MSINNNSMVKDKWEHEYNGVKAIIYKGDCLEVSKEVLQNNQVDLVLTDPPYNIFKKEKKFTANAYRLLSKHFQQIDGQSELVKWDSVELDISELLNEMVRVTRNLGRICLFSKEPFTSKIIQNNTNIYLVYLYKLYWNKLHITYGVNAKSSPMNLIEEILCFKKHKHGREYKEAKPFIYNLLNGAKYSSNVLEIPRELNNKKRLHPTQKPVELLKRVIKMFTNKGDWVADFTMGSGSTGVACLETGRNFIGIEMGDNWFEVAKKRLKESYIEQESYDKFI